MLGDRSFNLGVLEFRLTAPLNVAADQGGVRRQFGNPPRLPLCISRSVTGTVSAPAYRPSLLPAP